LAVALKLLIDEGQLSPLVRLPSERALAIALLVSRTTVMGAYDELKAEGYLVSAQGSGTWVAPGRPGRVAQAEGLHLFPWLHRLGPLSGPQGAGVIDLSAVAVPALDLVHQEVASIPTDEWAALTSSPGYFPLGFPPLRDAIASFLSDQGLKTSAGQVIVTTGAQQALSLVTSLWLEAGDTIVIEDPTYPAALPVLQSGGVRIVAVEMDHDGIRVDMVEEVLARERVDLIYVNPTFQNPTGLVLSRERRQQLGHLVTESDALLVECEVSVDLSFEGDEPPPSITSLVPDAPVVAIGSMSGLFWSGLRIGWLRGPEHLIARLGRSKATADLGTPLIDQLVSMKLLEQVDEARAARRAGLKEGFELVTHLLGDMLPEWSWSPPSGGPSLWVSLDGAGASEFAQVAARNGVLVLPGPICSQEENFADHIRLPFVLEEPLLTAGIERLARAWEEYRGRTQKAGFP